MSEQEKADIGRQLAEDTAADLKVHPQEDLGCCTVRTKGWSEQYPNITKAACDKKASPGITASWEKGSC